MHDGWMGFGGGFMWLVWLASIIGVIFLVKALVGGGSGGNRARNPSPLEILEQRYARGEIDKEEFEQKRSDLAS